MNKIKLKYIPPAVMNLWVVLFSVTLVAAYIALETYHAKAAAVMGFLALGCVGVMIDLSVFETTVIYGGSDIIKCKWKNKKWEIDLSKTEYVVLKIKTETVRSAYKHYLSVDFVYTDENGGRKESLEIRLDADEVKKCMLENMDNIPLMQLYRYIEENYPEKIREDASVKRYGI